MYQEVNKHCGLCLVGKTHGLFQCDFNSCPIAVELLDLHRKWQTAGTPVQPSPLFPQPSATPSQSSTVPAPITSLCIHDLGPHHKNKCPYRTQQVKEMSKTDLKKVGVCTNCGTSDKTFEYSNKRVIFHPHLPDFPPHADEAKTYGGGKCSSHNGYHFYWHALWSL